MVCANMDGTDKMPLLVIGKSANPRCFKNVRSLPVEYHANKKAWMTGDIFSTWVKQLDKMKKKKRKIALVIDNCPAHPKIPGLQSIELIFLPPNTTSKTQPMDQGIIQNLKVHYRKRVLLRYISAIDKKETPHISILDALHMLSQAWACVTVNTISNCFKHAGFANSTTTETEEEEDEFDIDDNIPLSRLRDLGLTPDVLQQFTDADNELQTCVDLTDDNILEEVKMNREPEAQSVEESDPDDRPAPVPCLEKVSSACDIVLANLQNRADSSDILTNFNIICDLVNRDIFKKKTSHQSHIPNFFK
ncbi:tigger transposable element-derived protein 4-like [Saccostrea echinata]|uniref:tigger transposable element-derived protein 4-like n=1 Tax=Saccostrea echinata TaxID=191078 RepID=UPI002A82A397|nr:tigger transposable element-derived protein 4-like [Saccostrea echinata]